MKTWNLQSWTGSVWQDEDPLPRPNASFVATLQSTMKKIPLFDGSECRLWPQVKYNKQPLQFVWVYKDNTLKTRLENYLKNKTELKITTQTGEGYEGVFISVESEWQVGYDPQIYGLVATFELFTIEE